MIVEAEYRSGTSITARFAKEQGRDVFCIPNARDNSKGIGTNMLIQKGAKLIMEPREIIERYSGVFLEKQISIEDLENSARIDFEEIKDEYREIYEVLSKSMSVSEIQEITGIELSELYQKLFMMEVDGLIRVNQSRYERNIKK